MEECTHKMTRQEYVYVLVKSLSALLQLHSRYILWPREYVYAYTQGNLKERKLQ